MFNRMYLALIGIWHLIWNPTCLPEEVVGMEREARQMKNSAVSEFNRAIKGVLDNSHKGERH